MQIYPEAEPFTHLAKVPFGVKQYRTIASIALQTQRPKALTARFNTQNTVPGD